MGRFLVVSKMDHIHEYKEVARDFGVGFEINDFFDPNVLDDEDQIQRLMEQYRAIGLPSQSTMHGAFYDVTVFSQDRKIREISKKRMRQSMEIAQSLGLTAVVFHVNANPYLVTEEYMNQVVVSTTEYVEKLLQDYSDIDIYLENMFEENPGIFKRIATQLKKYSNFGICLDYAHLNVYAKDVENWILELASYVKHIHINDNDLRQDLHMTIGDGKIDWNKFEYYYKAYFEHCSVLVETTPVGNQRRSLEYLKQVTNILDV